MKYYVLTLGCQMNISDSERLTTVFSNMGFVKTDKEEDADILGIVACSVRQKAIDKVYSRIHLWNKWKQDKNLITFVTGCLLDEDKKKFLKTFDLVFDTNDMTGLPDMISQYGVTTPTGLQHHHNQGEFWGISPSYDSRYEAFIPIQNGCDKFCTYCAVPYTRGREVSRPSSDILNEIKILLSKGYKSITLLGQNVNSYGLDKDEELSFAELLDEIGKIGDLAEHPFWLYFTSPHPRDMTMDVLETMARYKCLAKQIHLPLQSGDNEVLKKMNRNHSLADYRIIVNNIRRILPQATLFTDIIVGFTDESEDNFENTRLALEEFGYNMAYIAIYSPRPGAVSSRWDDKIPQDVKKRRLHILSDVFIKSAGRYNESLIRSTMDILVTGKSRDGLRWTGLTEGKINIHFNGNDSIQPGHFIPVKITGSTGISLQGEAVLS
ncbi:tRNA (N6-isopentenyl adenosine(37)-C2)-methylthiotransferase MiaB [Oceanispirochaeta sp.]|jgi:tRNA-2-methylthio-N6-dimethylallyladenosine synthase|uniref:tRNA (N6-isopentenyl adenosine(37)-C2)-methylthiotransferase MiaB n=1 Tax=Oceanispirochaeta sp. TaxID=2035350 RepID=UPI0026036057|nr:tRNA (N6-isopentenyl adenosine(37)-C2)-methylthiotransferase MiaB [Oceanispirochaeta sp.]MDA3955967.1 tRNA (N6-isopentenyl adenosine(37)-C2)-methylthiotransferase MiaB [Oceanispirochaeta sp.]